MMQVDIKYSMDDLSYDVIMILCLKQQCR